MDFFADDDHYFGANEYAISGEAQDENCNGLYQGDLFSSIKSPPEYVSLKPNRQYGHQSPRKYSNACYGYSSHPFPVRHETTSYQKTSVDPSADPLELSHKAAPIGDCIPRNMPTLEPPRSVMSQHKDSNLFPDEFTANLLSEMFELQDFSETDPQFGELMEKKDIVQRKQEKNRKKSQLLLKQPGRSCGDMNSRDFIERYKINRPAGSKDRHSKIVTSRGPRDRRIRLSVETAIKFFDVQDRLGFDQPGKAIEWLIEKSCSAIEQLRAMPPSPPDISSGQHTCSDSSLSFLHRDTQSTRADFITNYEENLGGAYSLSALSANLSTEPDVVQQHFCSRHKRNNPRKTGLKAAEFKTARRCIHEESLKENRSKARERARERTKEKIHTSESAASASSHMNYTKTVEIETFNLQETIASTSPETIVKETLMDASGKHLSCHSPTLKFGLLENPPTGYFHHRGNCIKAQDNSVKEFAGNLHMISDSNMSFSYSQSQIQSLVQYVAQPEDRNMQSTGSFSGLCSTTVPFSSCMFTEAVTPINGDMRTDYSLLLSPSIRSSAQPFMSL